MACVLAAAASGCEPATLSLLTPSATFEPARLTFGPTSVRNTSGPTSVSSTTQQTTRLVNTSPVPLTIDRVVTTIPDFELVIATGAKRGRPIVGQRVPPGTAFEVNATFTPEQVGRRETVMRVLTEDIEVPLTLSGEGTLARTGVVACQPSPVDFGPVQRGNAVTSQIRCTALSSSTEVTSVRIASGDDSFTLPNPPPLPAPLLASQSIDLAVRFTAEGLRRAENGQLSVEYMRQEEVAETHVSLFGEVVPPNVTDTAISARLDWDTDGTDVDLHLVAPGGTAFDPNLDCYFRNTNPDWGVRNDPIDDPFLDDDDVNGFGPENINLSRTAPGQYRVYAHYWRSGTVGASTARVEVFLGGQSVYTASQPLQCNDLWLVGTVSWNGSTGTFLPGGTVVRVTESSCR